MVTHAPADRKMKADQAHRTTGVKSCLLHEFTESTLGGRLALVHGPPWNPPAIKVAVAHEEHLPVGTLGEDPCPQANRGHHANHAGADPVCSTEQQVRQRHETPEAPAS